MIDARTTISEAHQGGVELSEREACRFSRVCGTDALAAQNAHKRASGLDSSSVWAAVSDRGSGRSRSLSRVSWLSSNSLTRRVTPSSSRRNLLICLNYTSRKAGRQSEPWSGRVFSGFLPPAPGILRVSDHLSSRMPGDALNLGSASRRTAQS